MYKVTFYMNDNVDEHQTTYTSRFRKEHWHVVRGLLESQKFIEILPYNTYLQGKVDTVLINTNNILDIRVKEEE